MTYERGHVVLIPFPFSDLESEKRRPVLLISAPDGFGDFVGVALTTRSHHPNSVALAAEDFGADPLPRPTWVRADKVFSLSSRRIVKAVARLQPEAVERVLAVLCGSVGYANNGHAARG